MAPAMQVRAALKKKYESKRFLASVFDERDKQLFPRDLLVGSVPSRRGGRRAVGVLRRSFRFRGKLMACPSEAAWFVSTRRKTERGCPRDLRSSRT